MKKIIILFVGFLIISCNTNSKDGNNDFDDKNFNTFISTQKLPDELTFCGEKVPLEIDEVRERAEREFYLLLQTPGQIVLYLKRSGRYFPLFEKIFKEFNVPDDLKYLSVAESALYMARSSKNAVGLWQFIPSTAQKMGLIINQYIDERRHPEKSTRAAIQYLKIGYQVTGSWFAAAAGYNMGHTNLQKHFTYQNKSDVFDLFMNEETSRYLLRIVIIKEIMNNAKKYGFKLKTDDYYQPYSTETIKVKSIDDLSKWAEENNTSYKYVRLLNPWILDKKLPEISKNHYYEILIPAK